MVTGYICPHTAATCQATWHLGCNILVSKILRAKVTLVSEPRRPAAAVTREHAKAADRCSRRVCAEKILRNRRAAFSCCSDRL